jgi:hypothetical protein
MISCIIIQNNNINENRVKNLTEETIYKKCNYKSVNDFTKIRSWEYEDNVIELWGKNKGLDNLKSDFVFFKENDIIVYGKSIFLMRDSDKYMSLTRELFIDYFDIKEEEKEEVKDEDVLKCKGNGNGKSNVKSKEEGVDLCELDDDSDNGSNYSYNSEISYELYSYSSDENN